MDSAGPAGLAASWDPQVQCPDQVAGGIREAIWNEALVADGVSWAPGLRRVPPFPTWNWNRSIAQQVQAPILLISGELARRSPSKSCGTCTRIWGQTTKNSSPSRACRTSARGRPSTSRCSRHRSSGCRMVRYTAFSARWIQLRDRSHRRSRGLRSARGADQVRGPRALAYFGPLAPQAPAARDDPLRGSGIGQ